MHLTNNHLFSNGDFKGIQPIGLDLTKLHPTVYQCGGPCGRLVSSVSRVRRNGIDITDACEDCIANDAKAREQVTNYLDRMRLIREFPRLESDLYFGPEVGRHGVK